MDEPKPRMPPRINLGKHAATSMAHCMMQYNEWKAGKVNTHGRRTVMGFVLPDWQRGLVWTEQQKIAFIESAWLGISIGTYAYNQARMDSPYDYLLVDGQQRMNAIQDYVEDVFPVFGFRWSELAPADERRWSLTTSFSCYTIETEDEAALRNYYNLTNFGGTAHGETDRA
jgi:hypothetical protein